MPSSSRVSQRAHPLLPIAAAALLLCAVSTGLGSRALAGGETGGGGSPPAPAPFWEPALEAWEDFTADPTLGGKLHLTYRAAYQAQFFRFHGYRFNFPEDADPGDRQAAEELEDRHRSNRDQDLDQYLAIRTQDLLGDIGWFKDWREAGYYNRLDTEFSLRWFEDLDGIHSGREAQSIHDSRSSKDLQLRTLNARVLFLREHLELTIGRQFIESAEWVHLDGGKARVRGLGLFGRPVELEAFGGRRVSFYSTISEKHLFGGAVRYFPGRDTRIELSDVQYIDNSFQALISQRFGSAAMLQLSYRQINEDPESLRLEALLCPWDWGLEVRAGYLGKFGGDADDFPFDYTFSDRVPRDDRDFDRRFNIGGIEPFDEVTLEARQEITTAFGVFAGATGHWVRDRGDLGVYNTDWYEVWGGVDTLHYPWEGLTGRLGVRFLRTDLPRRRPHPANSPEFISDVIGDGEPSFAGVELLLEQDLARRLAAGTRLEFRNTSYDSRFADLSGINAVSVTPYARFRQNRFLSYTLSYTYERDYRFINPDFEDLHAVRAQVQVSW